MIYLQSPVQCRQKESQDTDCGSTEGNIPAREMQCQLRSLPLLLFFFSSVSFCKERRSTLVLFLTDDQDLELFGLSPMRKTKRLLMDQGTMFTQKPPGWDWWNGLIGNSVYYNYGLSINGTVHSYGNTTQDYLTTVIKDKTMKFLNFAENSLKEKPLFLMVAPPAPHSPFTPQQDYRDKFQGVVAPRLPDYNVKGREKHWIVRQAPQPIHHSVTQVIDTAYRNRWKTLLSVDDLVESVIRKLTAIGRENSTYFIYTSDNGFHCGQFSLPLGKRQPYEFDIKVPLLMRGPGIPHALVGKLVANIDIAPTLLHMAGITKNPDYMDGRSLLEILPPRKPRKPWRKSLLIEYWGEQGNGIPEECADLRNKGLSHCQPGCVCEDAANNTYSCLRMVANNVQTLFCEFRDNKNFTELYNMQQDPYQLHNVAHELKNYQRRKLQRALKRFKQCSGKICRRTGWIP